MSRVLIRTLALVTALTLGAAACGGGNESDDAASTGVASLNDDSANQETADSDTSSDDTAEAPADPEQAYALFNDCMADYGFEFQTPTEGDDGLDIDDNTSNDEDDPQASDGDFDQGDFESANKDCEKHLANVDNGFDLDPEQKAELEDAQVKWNNCMKEQGVDMSTNDDGTVQTLGDDVDMEAFDAASKACEHHFDGLGSDDDGSEA